MVKNMQENRSIFHVGLKKRKSGMIMQPEVSSLVEIMFKFLAALPSILIV